MGGEPLTGPLTGIGQYTFHLVELIERSGEFEDIALLIHGRLRPATSILASCRQRMADQRVSNAGRGTLHRMDQLKSSAAQNETVMKIYKRLVPILERHALRHHCEKDIYHSPNYLLPDFPGHSVVTVHDLSTFRFPEHHPRARVDFVNSHIERALERADHILAVSNIVRDEIIERFAYPEDRITTTYEGANQTFRPISSKDFDKVGKSLGLSYQGYFLFVGSIEPRKNLERLLDAYLDYRAEEGSNAMPLIVSGLPGWNSRHTHERLRELEHKGVVRYLGYVQQQLLPPLIAGARALLYPSLYEGFGLPVMEAMSCGTAVMTSRDSSMSEIADGCALLVSPYDVESMQNALHSLTSDGQLVASMQEKGLSRSLTFSWEDCASRTLAVYKRVAHC